ncbi:hypothetical protein PACILC2_22720 [Paenibacillus cisolokensis]|uniref:Portal protein n=1 Tax=Paenibacillus cisolokensis TaxID=1658519 RepID=A0ABQ4N6C0_9BACL|nr:phage portal protein [Paenibacillus cisolokensis]GIQ63704.1 hypothetical protein PACILC2_22720 [Paenibacillus cisolokensis]
MTKLFVTGASYPPPADIERIAKYKRARAIYDGRLYEVYERASELLRDTPAAPQLSKLYIAVNLIDVLISKPADLMIGDPPSFESGNPDDSTEQKALNRIIEENDITQLIQDVVVGGGIRGDAWIKAYYAVRQDFSALADAGLPVPDANPEPIIEAVDACYVFPELARGSRKNSPLSISRGSNGWRKKRRCRVGVDRSKTDETPYLNVERHLPGYIVYERYRLVPQGVNTEYGVSVPVFKIGDAVPTGRDEDIIETGVNRPLVFHIPYKTTDDDWQGVGGIEKLESVLAAINDRLVQIDYILWKHSDPIAYGPDDIGDEDGANAVRWGGKYIPVGKEDAKPGYMTWNSELEGAFKELDLLLSLVFVQSETPQWLFGTVVAGADKGGTGTSHTDGVAIKARFMPILSKVRRIRANVDRALRDALWTAMELENYANEGVEGFVPYNPVYPKINWRDGIPKNEKEEAEIYSIRTGAKPTLDVKSAIKRMDALDDQQADEIIARMNEDEARVNGTVDGSVFNEVVV